MQFKNGIIAFECVFRSYVVHETVQSQAFHQPSALKSAGEKQGSQDLVSGYLALMAGMAVDKVVEAIRISFAAIYCQEKGMHSHASVFASRGVGKLIGSLCLPQKCCYLY